MGKFVGREYHTNQICTMKQEDKLLQEAIDFNKQEKFTETIDLLSEQVLEKFNNADLYAEKAQAYWRVKNNEQCELMANKSLLINSNNAKAHHYLGHIYSEKEYEKAIEHYEKAIELAPNLTYSYHGLGNAYSYKKEYDKAIECYNKAVLIDPQYSSAYHNLGIVYSDKENYDKAIECYDKAIQLDSNLDISYYCRADVYFEQNKLKDSLKDYETYISLAKEKSGIYYSFAIDRIEIIKKKINSKDFEKISNLVSEIKKMLLYEQDCITHYTGISIAKELIINNSKLRLSEGTFLNDTSEGNELLNYLNLNKINPTVSTNTSEIFTQKPFIGSFVAETKHNDLTLWRMYGKEGKEEAKGCAITLNKEILIQSIKDKLAPDSKSKLDNRIAEEFNFYKVAYLKDQQFILTVANANEQNSLNDAMQSLVKAIEDFKSIPIKNKEYKKDIIEELNKIAYLFKSAEYQHENEVRLVVNLDYEKKIDQVHTPPKVYIELVPITKSIAKITIGPKVERADEWAAAFYHHLDKEGIKPEINISHLPFK